MIDLATFEEVTDEVTDNFSLVESSSSKKRKHYFLMRLPYDMDISDLSGVTVDKSSMTKFIRDNGCDASGGGVSRVRSAAMGKDIQSKRPIGKLASQSTSSSRRASDEYYAISLESAEPYNTFRPIVKDESSSSLRLGDSFVGVLSVTSAAQVIAIDASTVTIPTAYSKKDQIDGLKIRSVPTGSLSTVADINGRRAKFEALDRRPDPSPSPTSSRKTRTKKVME